MIDAGHGVECGFCLRVLDFQQAIDLFDVEYGVPFPVRDFALDILAGLVVVLGARDAVGVNDERAFLAFAHMRVEFEGLAECHSDGRGEILDRRGHPERESVDSTVGLTVVAQRTGNPAGGVFGVLWFHPAISTRKIGARGGSRIEVINSKSRISTALQPTPEANRNKWNKGPTTLRLKELTPGALK